MSYIPREGSNMNNESLSNNDDKNYQDFKTYKPQTLKYLTKEQEELVETHTHNKQSTKARNDCKGNSLSLL